MKKGITTKTTIRLSIKGVDHDLTPEEAKAIIDKLREAVNEKPQVIIREIEKFVRPNHLGPSWTPKPPPFWPDITCGVRESLAARPGGLCTSRNLELKG